MRINSSYYQDQTCCSIVVPLITYRVFVYQKYITKISNNLSETMFLYEIMFHLSDLPILEVLVLFFNVVLLTCQVNGVLISKFC